MKEYMIKKISGYENYMVDTDGNVFRIKKDGLKILKPMKNSDGYLQVKLYLYGVYKYFTVHRLILLTFCPNENSDKLTVNHKDEDKTNNSLENLEWLTIGDNVRYSKSKPIVQLDKNDNLVGVYESSRLAQQKTGCDQSSIIKCINGKAKTCGGYKWILYEDYFKLTVINKDHTK